MTDKIVSLVGRRPSDHANQDAIACLETWLDMARSGIITSVACAGVGPGGARYGFSSYVDEGMIGAVSILQHKIIAETQS